MQSRARNTRGRAALRSSEQQEASRVEHHGSGFKSRFCPNSIQLLITSAPPWAWGSSRTHKVEQIFPPTLPDHRGRTSPEFQLESSQRQLPKTTRQPLRLGPGQPGLFHVVLDKRDSKDLSRTLPPCRLQHPCARQAPQGHEPSTCCDSF